MKNPTEIAVLRTMLRQVNVEYSALVRSAADASKTARLDELRTQRSALMTRIAELGSSVGDMLPRQTPIPMGAVVAEFSPQSDTYSSSPQG